MSGPGLIRYRRRCASTRDTTNPASRSTRRCFETEGCVRFNLSSRSPTDRSQSASRLRMARRLGSAMMANVDSMTLIYPITYIHVKASICRNGAIVRFASRPGLFVNCKQNPWRTDAEEFSNPEFLSPLLHIFLTFDPAVMRNNPVAPILLPGFRKRMSLFPEQTDVGWRETFAKLSSAAMTIQP